MFNLMGYYYDGAVGNGGAPSSGDSASSLLLPSAGYPGTVELPPLDLSYPAFMEGKKCYIGYGTKDVWGDPTDPNIKNVRIDTYYGPYYFGFGIVDIPPVEDWLDRIGSYVDENGNTVSGPPAAANYAHCNWIYCVVGEPAADAHFTDTLPEDAFCANYNQGYALPYMFSLYGYVYDYVNSHLRKTATGGQYKFNGRYVSTGSGGSSSYVNIRTGLKVYEGFKMWATGWLQTGASYFAYIKKQYGGLDLYPSCNSSPFTAYTPAAIIANPDFIHYLSTDIVIPSIATYGPSRDTISTAATVSYDTNIVTGRAVVKGCAPPSAGSLNTPFQLKGLFSGYEYPGGLNPSGLWMPSWASGFIFTSEGVEMT